MKWVCRWPVTLGTSSLVAVMSGDPLGGESQPGRTERTCFRETSGSSAPDKELNGECLIAGCGHRCRETRLINKLNLFVVLRWVRARVRGGEGGQGHTLSHAIPYHSGSAGGSSSTWPWLHFTLNRRNHAEAPASIAWTLDEAQRRPCCTPVIFGPPLDFPEG